VGEYLLGNAADNFFYGIDGRDRIYGYEGNDFLKGGLGADYLRGGAGNDTFDYDSVGHVKGDAIYDFVRGQDKIDFRNIDANSTKGGNQNFSFIGKKAFTKAGQVHTEKKGGYTHVSVNTDADAQAEATLKIKGYLNLSKADFIL
jgi:Ca2+-binding RTX toxin-like protein